MPNREYRREDDDGGSTLTLRVPGWVEWVATSCGPAAFFTRTFLAIFMIMTVAACWLTVVVALISSNFVASGCAVIFGGVSVLVAGIITAARYA